MFFSVLCLILAWVPVEQNSVKEEDFQGKFCVNYMLYTPIINKNSFTLNHSFSFSVILGLLEKINCTMLIFTQNHLKLKHNLVKNLLIYKPCIFPCSGGGGGCPYGYQNVLA